MSYLICCIIRISQVNTRCDDGGLQDGDRYYMIVVYTSLPGNDVNEESKSIAIVEQEEARPAKSTANKKSIQASTSQAKSIQ
jgi:hypothetical protein